MRIDWKKLAARWGRRPAPSARRRLGRPQLSWDGLEDRVVLSHAGAFHHLHAAAQFAGTGTPSNSTAANSTMTTARQTLQTDVRAIEAASSTTIGELTTLRTTSQAVRADGLTPTSPSALATFENGLVTASAAGTALAGNATLLAQYEALYTATPTAQQTTDLTASYNALAAAVTSANITAANLTTINADEAAILAAEGNTTTTSTYPYFSLVSGNAGFGGFGGFGRGGFGGPGGGFNGPSSC